MEILTLLGTVLNTHEMTFQLSYLSLHFLNEIAVLTLKYFTSHLVEKCGAPINRRPGVTITTILQKKPKPNQW